MSSPDPDPGPGAERRPVVEPRPGPGRGPAPRTASAPPPSYFDVAVVGGGLLGCAVALFLSRSGMRTALVERGGLCREASGVNAGTLTMQMTRAALIPYALEAHRMWASARKWLGHDVGVTACDGLALAFTEGEAALLEERARARREAGAPIRLLGLEAARRIEPGLSRRPVLASHCSVDGFASAYLTGLAFRRALVGAGARIFEHCPATGVEPGGGGYVVRPANPRQPPIEARRLVFAGGAWLGEMAGWLGVRLPVRALVNQLAVTERLPPVMRTVVGVASGLLSLKQFANGTAVVGGGWQAAGERERGGGPLLPGRLVGNLRLACHAIPALRGARLVRTWSGLEAETRDALPAVGPLPGHPGAFVCGSVHSGFTSGPWIARLLADRILGREPAMPLFPPDRLIERPNRGSET